MVQGDPFSLTDDDFAFFDLVEDRFHGLHGTGRPGLGRLLVEGQIGSEQRRDQSLRGATHRLGLLRVAQVRVQGISQSGKVKII